MCTQKTLPRISKRSGNVPLQPQATGNRTSRRQARARTCPWTSRQRDKVLIFGKTQPWRGVTGSVIELLSAVLQTSGWGLPSRHVLRIQNHQAILVQGRCLDPHRVAILPFAKPG